MPLEPSKEALDDPAPLVAAQAPAILARSLDPV
jgi:hypothetical protein